VRGYERTDTQIFNWAAEADVDVDAERSYFLPGWFSALLENIL
jgi:hypothetical protein